MLSKWLRWLCLGALLAGCADIRETARPIDTPVVSPTPTALPLQASPTPDATEPGLTVWLPPEFAPEARVPGGSTLAAHVAQFEAEHPGLQVRVRVKAASGPGGLLDSLLATYNAAPTALPDLVALTRDDLTAAAAAGAVMPLDDYVPLEARQDYYPFAQALGRVQGQWIGLPFAADARLLVYNTDLYATAPLRWSEVVTGTLIFPAAEAASLTVMSDYLAAGGAVTDSAGKPMVEPARLAATLSTLRDLEQAGVVPVSTLSYADPAATWQVFRERRVMLAVTSARLYFTEAGRVNAASAGLPPTADGTPFTLADGWSWALVNKNADRTEAADLLNWLTEPARLAAWTLAAGMLPTRAAVLARWQGSRFAPLAAAVLTRALLQPSTRVLSAVGPVLRRAVEDVLNGRATPEAAAETAAQALAEAQP